MAQVYIHLPKLEAEHVAACGIKLSEHKVQEFTYKDKSYNCFLGWLHPSDDVGWHRNHDYSCIRLDIEDRYCFVGDLDIYPSELYFATLKPMAEYCLGEFRRPQCLICCTVLPVQVSLQGRRLDVPLLYENSEQLYLENLQSFFDGKFHSFENDKLYAFFDMLASRGHFEKIENEDIVTFIGKEESNGQGKNQGKHLHFSFTKPNECGYSFEGL